MIPGLGIGIGIDCNGIFRNGVRFDLPTMGAFSVAVGWANDDLYDIAMKFADTFDDLKVNFNAGYSLHKNGGLTATTFDDTDLWQFQGGVMHIPTGLFGVATYQNEQTDDVLAKAAGSDDTDSYYYKAGIRTGNWTNIGDSALYVEYGIYKDEYGLTGLDDGVAGLTGSEFTRVGFVVEQYFGARFLIYGKYEEFSLDTSGPDSAIYDSAKDLELMTLGMTLFF